MFLQKILTFIDNLDKSHEYHEAIRSNLNIIKNRIEEKKKKRIRQVKEEGESYFDYVEFQKSDLCDIIREYSSTYFVCRISYCYPTYTHYYWTCCSSRKMSHEPYAEHRDDIEYVRNRIKKFD